MPGVDTHGENVPTGTGELPNVRVYTLGVSKGTHSLFARCSRMSKTGCYENPYAVTGSKVLCTGHRLRGST